VQRGRNTPAAKSLPGRLITTGGASNPNSITSAFFNTVHLLPKDLRFEHAGTKVASCPGRHLTRYASAALAAYAWNCFLAVQASWIVRQL